MEAGKLTISQVKSNTIEIRNDNGQKYWLNLVDGKLEAGGDLPMSEAARTFFDEVKRIAGKR